MTSVSPVFKWAGLLEYEFVAKRFNKAKIIVFVESIDPETLRVSYDGKHIMVYGYGETATYYTRIKVWFKIRRVEFTVRNGVLTLNVRGRRLPFLPF